MERTRIPRSGYRGSDPKKRAKLIEENQLCELIEAELRRRYTDMKPGTSLVVTSYDVARTIGRDPEKVRELIFRIDAGHNGVTLWKPVDAQFD
jgi:hypothetical protein